ncbi:MAG: succinate dehydrogenase iron-sulfur subunit [Chloroflexi bacterium]|nr:succinate dehydrogenase iron-sulfur subunit [Chloroflexota bacterium]
MHVTIQVKRFNPEASEAKPFFQKFPLEVESYFTVLDALIKIREERDETLAVRCSCRASICGSCAMRINGHASLGCKTKLSSVMDSSGTVRVEPAGNLPVVKDLVVDMKPFWDKVRAVEPWLQPQGPEPEGEYVAPNEAMLHLAGVMGCIMCGACVSDCTVLEVDRNFLGPAALAKAYRFVADPRDAATKKRLTKYDQYGGIWDCTRCYECVQVCPKGVAPMERIMAMRSRAMEAGFDKSYGARHSRAFEKGIEHGGRLDETRLMLDTVGITNVPKLINLIPVALRATYRRKLPPLIHKKLPGVQNVRRIFKKVGEAQQQEQTFQKSGA